MKVSDFNKINYTGIFFKDGTHMTWNFGFPLVYPHGVKSGELARVKVIGKYEDDQVACLVVQWNNHTKQPKGTLLHITTKVTNGGKPVLSGLRVTERGYISIAPFYLDGVWR